MFNRRTSPWGEKVFWPLIFILTLLKYAYYRYQYYPVLDDNNMYGFFRVYKNIFKDVILGFGMYTTRPIAALLDPYFWSKFWDHLWIPLIIMTLLHFLTCVLLYKIFEKAGLPIGFTAVAIFALLPFGSEATYWLAASTRIVVGLFFTALSLYLLYLYFERERYKDSRYHILILFSITHLISLGFYEQLIAMSFFVLALIFITRWGDLRSRWVVLLPVVNFGIIVFWYKLFSASGNMAARGQAVQGGLKGLIRHSYDVTHAVFDVWKLCTANFLKYAFPGGIQTVLADKAYVFILLTVLLSIAVFIFLQRENFDGELGPNLIKLGLGLFLFVIPYAPFYAINQIWVANRNIFLSFIGLGLIVEAVLNILSANRPLTAGRNLLLTLMVFAFFMGNVYELTYYRNVGKIDSEITGKISQAPESKQGKDVLLFNTKLSYVLPTAGRVENCTASDWAFTGALYAQRRELLKMKEIHPVPDQTFIQLKKDFVLSSALLGIDDSRNIFPLKTTQEPGDKLVLSKNDGVRFGEVEFTEDGHMVFRVEKKE